jgi:hypothetical protein
MSRAYNRIGALVFLAAAAMVGASSCAANESSMYIRAMLSNPPDTCEVKADASALALSSGTFDPQFGSAYAGWVLVANQLVRRGDADRLRTETSKIEFQKAVIRVVDLAKLGGNDDPYDDSVLVSAPGATFTTPVSGFAEASTGATPGLGLAQVLMIPNALGKAMAKNGRVNVLVDVVLHGRTLGGINVETGHWGFPVLICGDGCLCDLTACAAGSTTVDMPIKNCHPGVDYVADCRLKLTTTCSMQ